MLKIDERACGDVDYHAEERAAMKAYFAFRRGFRLSKRGNLWRRWGDLTLTIFEDRVSGSFKVCIADGDRPGFSTVVFESVDDAILGLWRVVKGKR